MSNLDPILSIEELEAVHARFPAGYLTGRGRRQVPLHEIIINSGPLTEEHVASAQALIASGDPLGVQTPTIKSIRNTHHRLAQLLAGGMDEVQAALLCNYSVNRVSILKSDPAFKELLAYYARNVAVEFQDFVSAAAALSEDVVHRLQQIMDEEPEKLSPSTLIEMGKFLADRSGNAPVTRTHNVNVNIGMGDRIRAARLRAEEAQRAQLLPPAAE